MPTTFDALANEALSLPQTERAKLAQVLLHSLDRDTEEDPVEVEKAWLDEIERRMKDVRAGHFSGRAAEEVFAELRAKHG